MHWIFMGQTYTGPNGHNIAVQTIPLMNQLPTCYYKPPTP